MGENLTPSLHGGGHEVSVAAFENVGLATLELAGVGPVASRLTFMWPRVTLS
jgi:hypothetical protein